MNENLQDRLQAAAGDITDDFDEKDQEYLSRLAPDQLATQAAARWELYHYIDKIWEAPHLRENGQHPNDVPGYAGVAALRDILGTLTANADEAMGGDIDVATVKTTVERDK